jgi:retinol dehydrogenase-12
MNEKGIDGSSVCLHPGVIPTDLPRDYGKVASIMKVVLSPLLYLFLKTPWEGAQTTLYLTLQADEKLEKGQYYKDCKESKTSQFSSNMHNADRLWKLSEELLGIKFTV